MSSIINRIRTKSFSSINQLTGNNHTTIPAGPSGYCYIENFEFTTEEECIKIDNENLNLYRKNKHLYDEISKKIETKNALFKIEKAPSPPLEPNNYEKFIKYKQRNITKNVRLQTFAVQKLLERGYRLHYDLVDKQSELDFEPYEAIEILEKTEYDTIENIFKNNFYLNNSLPQINKIKVPVNQILPLESLSSPPLSTSPPLSSSPSLSSYQRISSYQPLSSTPPLSSTLTQQHFSPEYPQYYYPQPYASNYPHLSSTTPPTTHRNVAPPAAHYISNG